MAAKPGLIVVGDGVEVQTGPRQEVVGDVDFAGLRRALASAVARVVPGWLATHREDLVQSAMMRIVQVVEHEPSGERLSAGYLWRVAYSVTIDEIRRQRARSEGPLDDPDRETGATQPSPERAAAGRQIGAGIRDCLAGLADDRRRAVTLYLLGHGVTEIATLLGWNVKRAENLTGRGLADVRACLASKGMEP